MRALRLPAGLALALLTGCASNLARYTDDVGAAGDVLAARDVPRPDLGGLDDGALDPRALELLAQGLDEQRAVRVALLNNRGVRAAFAALGVAAAEAAQAGAIANPGLTAEAKFFSGGTELELALVQPILEALTLPLRRDLGAQRYAVARARVAGELVGLVHAVRRALVRARAAELEVALARDALVAASASHDLMAELYRAGNVTAARLVAERVELSRAQLDLAAAEARAQEAREPLNVLLGLWGAAVGWELAVELGAAPSEGLAFEDAEARAVRASLGLEEVRARAAADARALGVERWETLLPGAGLGVAAKREASDGAWGLGPALTLELPVLDGGGPRRRARARALEETLARHVTLAVEVRATARLLVERARVLAVRARYLHEQHLPAHAELVRRTLHEYNSMQVGVFEVLHERRRELDAAREHVRTLRDAWLARIDLEELYAGRLDPRHLSGADQEAPEGGAHRP